MSLVPFGNEAVGHLLEDAPARQTMTAAAATYARSEAGTLDAILEALAPALERALGKAKNGIAD